MTTSGVSGGEKFDAAVKEIAAKLTGGGNEVRVGFLSNATYPDGKKVAFVAAMNEFGHRIVRAGKTVGYAPARPFFRNMISAKKPEWPAAMGKQLVANNYDVAKTLDVVGTAVAGQLRQSIVDLTEPPLAQSTIDRKGFDKPLIGGGQTGGHMLNSVDHEVVNK